MKTLNEIRELSGLEELDEGRMLKKIGKAAMIGAVAAGLAVGQPSQKNIIKKENVATEQEKYYVSNEKKKKAIKFLIKKLKKKQKVELNFDKFGDAIGRNAAFASFNYMRNKNFLKEINVSRNEAYGIFSLLEENIEEYRKLNMKITKKYYNEAKTESSKKEVIKLGYEEIESLNKKMAYKLEKKLKDLK